MAIAWMLMVTVNSNSLAAVQGAHKPKLRNAHRGCIRSPSSYRGSWPGERDLRSIAAIRRLAETEIDMEGTYSRTFRDYVNRKPGFRPSSSSFIAVVNWTSGLCAPSPNSIWTRKTSGALALFLISSNCGIRSPKS